MQNKESEIGLLRGENMGECTQEQMLFIEQQVQEIMGAYREAISRSGVLENEFWIWYTLVMTQDGDFSQQDLSNICALPKQTVNTIVRRMAERGHVVLKMVPGTRNRKRIYLTETGAAFGRALVAPIIEAERRAYENLPEEDRRLLPRILRDYTHTLRQELDQI